MTIYTLKGASSLLKFVEIEVSTTGDTGPAAMYFSTQGFGVERGIRRYGRNRHVTYFLRIVAYIYNMHV